VLSVIIRRVRGDTEAVPLVRAYDRRECLWIGPAPLLFQRRFGAESRRICDSTIRNMLNAALASTGLTDHTDGNPLHYSPHDFRRIFITDALHHAISALRRARLDDPLLWAPYIHIGP
jgi:hypothetical protein